MKRINDAQRVILDQTIERLGIGQCPLLKFQAVLLVGYVHFADRLRRYCDKSV